MSFVFLSGLFAFVLTLHNLEEALLLPKWSQSANRWHTPVGLREFRFAVVVLTIFSYVVVFWAVVGGKESISAYLLLGYALAMLLNVLFPHVLATLVMRRYAPGTGSALLFNLPCTLLLLYKGFQDGYVQVHRFIWVGPLVVVGILVVIPVLFAIGRLQPRLKKS